MTMLSIVIAVIIGLTAYNLIGLVLAAMVISITNNSPKRK